MGACRGATRKRTSAEQAHTADGARGAPRLIRGVRRHQSCFSRRTAVNDKGLRVLASVGLAVGGVFGMAGTFAPSAFLRGLAWGIDGVGLVMAGALGTPVVFPQAGGTRQKNPVGNSARLSAFLEASRLHRCRSSA